MTLDVIYLFEKVILEAGEQYFLNPSGAQIPDWKRALAVLPDLREQFTAAARSDTEGARVMNRSSPDAEIHLMPA